MNIIMNKNMSINREALIFEAKNKILEIKKTQPTCVIDCWSVYKDGIATENCKFAIDVRMWNNADNFGADIIENDPYKKAENLTRFKFL